MKSNIVTICGQQAFTTSLVVAEQCGVAHKNTIALIRKYAENFKELDKGRLTFSNSEEQFDSRLKSESIKRQSGGQKTIVAILNEDQAAFLILLFKNTTVAFNFKLALIKEFRKAIDEINHLYANPPRTGLIRAKRDVHKDMMNALVEYRDDLGKETDAKHFMCENKLCNGVVTGKYAKCNESELSNSDLELLALVRKRNEAFLMAGIDYQDRKKRLIAFAMKHRTKLISSL